MAVIENENVGPSRKKASFKSAHWNSASPTSPAAGSDGSSSFNISNNSIDTDTDTHPEQRPIVVLFRHSSPMERLLTQSAMEKVLSFTGKSPSWLLYLFASHHHHNMIPIELAGIVVPPSFASWSTMSPSLTGTTNNQLQLINQLIQQKMKVSLQLLAQRTATHNNLTPNKRGDLDPKKYEDGQFPLEDEIQSTAICHMHYRKPDQWLATTNTSLEMVKRG